MENFRFESMNRSAPILESSAQDSDPDRQKYADPRIKIQGVKYKLKNAKKTFVLLKPKSELLKEEIITIFISEWLIEFKDKNMRTKYNKKYENYFLFKNSVNR